MFVYKLRLAIAAQQHTKVVEPCDDALQLYTVDQEDRHWDLRLSDMVQKCILQILSVRSHEYYTLILATAPRSDISLAPI